MSLIYASSSKEERPLGGITVTFLFFNDEPCACFSLRAGLESELGLIERLFFSSEASEERYEVTDLDTLPVSEEKRVLAESR